MPRAYLFIIPILFLGCKNGCNKTDEKPAESNFADTSHSNKITTDNNNPLTADSIAPPSVKDTAMFRNEYDRDSFRMGIAFQNAANGMCKVLKERNAVGYLKYTPPAVLKVFGGKANYISSLTKGFSQESGTISRIVAGPVKRVAASVDDEGYSHGWYCLIPVRRFLIESGHEVMEMQWFGGQTLDEGKNCYFINVTQVSRDKILGIMPDLRFVLDAESDVISGGELP